MAAFKGPFDVQHRSRKNSFTANSDTITAATSNGSYVDFATTVVIPANLLVAGSTVRIVAKVVVDNAAAGSATLQTKVSAGSTTLIETEAVDPTGGTDDWQAHDLDINVPSAPGGAVSVDLIGTWATMTDGTLANGATGGVVSLATNGSLTFKVSAKWSANEATTTARLAQFNVYLD